MTRIALFADTETQKLPLFSEPSEDPRQPHIVQLGAILVDLSTWREIATLDVVIKPEGWTIPQETTDIHGITTEHALAVGVPERLAVELLIELWRSSDLAIGHNWTFDQRIVRIACMRFAPDVADAWKAGPYECTQVLSTPILKLPPTAKMLAAKRTHFKSANLREAVEYFTGKPLENAHSAIADVRGCIAVYRAIKDLQREAAAA